ncbi:stage II sporulation protein E [Neobacillus notoginsengisoli]|uniref:Stage II sporulation protein E n=1 Tax=Neobacillus notoginsengisoli TaxID=1578198 RepID=A0A417YG78_9BACI|nr:stage II sporulation protein E [Neobacillus notoginsengisoli]RHW31817.1 stage II sporulation protein E [Neobacillus notoginsengisoli]
MERAEQSMVEPMPGRGNSVKWDISLFKKMQARVGELFVKKGYFLFLVGFLLGRALILSKLTPFGLPFFAAVFFIKRDRAPLALLGLVAGAATVSMGHAASTFAIAFLFLAIFKVTKQWVGNPVKALPYYTGLILLVGKLAERFIVTGSLTIYDGAMAGVEGILAFILSLIFIQSVPLVTLNKRKQLLKTEEIVSLIILLASIMTGTIGWIVYGISIEHVMSRYLVLLFSLMAGAAVGSTVGVVTGLIFSLANVSSFTHMSLLAFSGVLGGLLKEGKKAGVSIGLMVATLLIGMYGETGTPLQTTMMETAAAILLLVMTPTSLTAKIAKYIPGTPEHTAEQQKYMRKMRDVTAKRVAQFSNVFEALSKSFSQHDKEIGTEEKELDFFLSNVAEKSCQTCFKKEHCWTRNFSTTYGLMEEIMLQMDQSKASIPPKLAREWEKHCSRPKKVMEAIHQELAVYQANQKLKKQVQESRRLVAEQLLGVSEVMGDFALEIQRERENLHKQEEQIMEAIQEFGLQIEQVDIYSLEQGNVDIDMTIPFCNGHGECEKLIAPMLSDILGETIVVNSEDCGAYPNSVCQATFRSAKAFAVENGVAYAAKDGGFISGDSFSTIELGSGKYAVAISDGMGNGERAQEESKETLQLLRQILQSGIEEKVAIKSVNSVLSLRTTDEIFSTLDLAVIDLQNASAKFLKIGSTPSFIKRGNKVIKIQASNLPMGIVQEFDIDVVSEQLKAGDLLIMMSDGVFEGPKHVGNYEMWMKRKIHDLETEDPQEVADLIMEEVIRSRSNQIEDDMTVSVTKIKHNTPKWATIPVQSIKKKQAKQA